jgi:hypothetical protein
MIDEVTCENEIALPPMTAYDQSARENGNLISDKSMDRAKLMVNSASNCH